MPGDRGLIQDVRPASAEVTGQQRELFAFDAFEYEDPNKNDPAKITVKEGWKLNLQRAVIGDNDLSTEGGFLNLDLLDVNEIFAQEITVTGSIQSENYVPNITGWKISNTSIEIDDGIFRGNLDAAGGTFTGQLDAAGGTFTGDLQAATGEFEHSYGKYGSFITNRFFSGNQVFPAGSGVNDVTGFLFFEGFPFGQTTNIFPVTATFGNTEIVGIWSVPGSLFLVSKTDTIELLSNTNLSQTLTFTSIATPVEITSSIFPTYFLSGLNTWPPPSPFFANFSKIALGSDGSNNRFPFAELHVGQVRIYRKTSATSVALNGYGAVASTSSIRDDVNLPIGTYIAMQDTDDLQLNRNALEFPRLNTADNRFYQNSGSGALLAGNWRYSGVSGATVGGSGIITWNLLRRVA